MPVLYRLLLVMALMSVGLTAFAQIPDRRTSRTSTLAWNIGNRNLPLLSVPDVVHGDLNNLLAYPGAEFGFPLTQLLSYSKDCDCYSLTVMPNASRLLQVVQLWRTPTGFYRSQNGPYVELEAVGPLTTLTALDGTRYLFAEVGQGERRCASIHSTAGNYLLIDYTADGLISRLRDSASRTIVPTYQDGRIVSLTQTWRSQTGLRTQTAVVVP